jgi:hypothetical protein
MKLFKRDPKKFREIWRAGAVPIALFVGSAVIVALAVSYIASAAGF